MSSAEEIAKAYAREVWLKHADEALDQFRFALQGMDPADRVAYFAKVTEDYCPHCGGPARNEHGQACQCENDE